MIKFNASLFALAVILAGCSVQSKSTDTVKPGEAKGGFMGLSTEEAIKVDTAAAFKGQSKVVIAAFKVGFMENKKASAKAGMGFGGKSSANMTLKGVDTNLQQQITDAAYADFVARLQKAGYSLAERSELLTSADFKGVNSEASPFKEEVSLFNSDTEITYVAPSALGRIYFTGESGHTGGFGFSNPMAGASGYADKTKTPVVFVSYLVDFAGSDGSGGRWSAVSSLEVGQGISIPPNSGLMLFGGQGGTFSSANGSIKFGQPVYSQESFGEVIKTSSDAAVAAETALNVLTTLAGAGSNQSRSFDIVANPDKYKKVTASVLEDANSKIIDQMVRLR